MPPEVATWLETLAAVHAAHPMPAELVNPPPSKAETNQQDLLAVRALCNMIASVG